ncbi:MAG TPA: hypothetical protein DEB46_07390, partial [Myxococcales bacterium]|nr:hypothetical protein [Myxococcales bacterium]
GNVPMRFYLLITLLVTACPAAETEPTADAGMTLRDSGPTDPPVPVEKVRPMPRSELLGAFDEQRRQLVFFGGDDGLPIDCQTAPHPVGLDDLWIYDAASATFEEIFVEGAKPPARARGMAVYDPTGDQMVIFGGRFRRRDRGEYVNFKDVWALDLENKTWRQIETGSGGPTARSNPAGGFDRQRGEMIVFGGNTSRNGLAFGPQNDTYALNMETGTWRSIRAEGERPEARLFHAAAVDSEGQRLFIYGGGDANAWQGPFLGDLWVLDLEEQRWEQLHNGRGANVPMGRIWATVAYDATSDRLLLFGGHNDGDLANNNDTWSFDLSEREWINLTEGETIEEAAFGFCDFPPNFTVPDLEAPERRSAHLSAMDETRGEWILFAGETDCGIIDDVWVFDMQREGWIELFEPKVGESCVRGENPEACVALCPQ